MNVSWELVGLPVWVYLLKTSNSKHFINQLFRHTKSLKEFCSKYLYTYLPRRVYNQSFANMQEGLDSISNLGEKTKRFRMLAHYSSSLFLFPSQSPYTSSNPCWLFKIQHNQVQWLMPLTQQLGGWVGNITI